MCGEKTLRSSHDMGNDSMQKTKKPAPQRFKASQDHEK